MQIKQTAHFLKNIGKILFGDIMGNTVEIKKLFKGMQEQMIAKLNAQDFISHPGTKGDVTENNWLSWMKEFLPKRYAADKAFVIDSDGQVSDQIDIVIYDKQYSPIVFQQNGALYVTAESVYAVFEVKQDLTKDHIEYAGNKIASVRELRRTSAPIVYSTGTKPAKPLHKIIGGLLTTHTQWTKPIEELLKKHLTSLNLNEQIDLVCCLKDSSYSVEYLEDRITLHKNTDDEVLIYVFLELLLFLQKIGTVPAIDLLQYAKAIDSI